MAFLAFIATVLIVLSLALIGVGLFALTHERFASELREAREGHQFFAAILSVGGLAVFLQTVKGNASGYVWQSPTITLRKHRHPSVYRLMLVFHYLASAAMVLMGAALWE